MLSAAHRGTPASAPEFARLAIVGCGLIGGSLALAVRSLWPAVRIVGVDRPAVIAAARRLGAIDAGSDDLAVTADADLIVLAAPVRRNLDVLQALASATPGEAVVTDVSGTKRDIVAAAAALPDRLAFVGGHPLAGAARGGIEQARADLFAGRPWILTPPAASDPRPLQRLEAFVQALGGRPRRMTPDDHDRLLAFLSHLPQLTVSALMQVVGEHAGVEGLALAGSGLRDTTRLAASPPDIWRDVVDTNRDHVAAALDALSGALQRLKPEAGPDTGIEDTFTAAARWKTVLERGAGGGDSAVRTYVEMRDPSALRRVTCESPDVQVRRLVSCPASFYRYLYGEVGRRYHWVDRAAWSDRETIAHVADPAVSVWLLSVAGTPAGWFELKRDDGDGVEIAYLGLLDDFTGRGLGGYLVSEAAAQAWALGPTRVWLHTCSLDHPGALPNYLKRGFVPFRTEEYSL